MLAELKIKPNLLQSGAITLQVCLDDNPEKLEKLAHKAGELFDVQMEKGLVTTYDQALYRIHHYRNKQPTKQGYCCSKHQTQFSFC